MQLHIFNPYSNTTVTTDYVDTIAEALKAAGYEAQYVSELKKQRREDKTAALVIAVKDAVVAKQKGYSKVFLWVQGIVPEESYMRNKSKLKYAALSAIEYFGLRCADFVFYVSDAMQAHFKKKYRYQNANSYIMPCFNAEIDEESFFADKKYENNVFLYAGGLDAWQCFEETVALYKKLETVVPNASLRVLTKDKKTAEEVLKKYNIASYSIDFRPSSEMKEEMSKAKFGFSLRQEHIVNLVATPTKLSTYVGNGVIPIYSKYISDFYGIAKDARFLVCAEDGLDGNLEKISGLASAQAAQEVLEEYRKLFGEYYSKQYHINRITKKVSE